MRSCNKVQLMVFFISCILVPSLSIPSSVDPDFDSLKQRYLSLRNTDPEVIRVDEWKALTAELLSYAGKKKKSKNAPVALYYGAILSACIADAYLEEETMNLALSGLEEIASVYPESDIADDALLMKGDLKSKRGDADAMISYQKILTDYPKSDMASVARERLEKKSLEQNGKTNAGTTESDEIQNESEEGKGPRIVIDPGHGGEDRGAVGIGNLFEKDVVLSVALEVEEFLTQKGFEIVLTRESDVFVPLAERAALANSSNAAVYVSLHANASVGSHNSGLETYVLDNSNNEAALKLAARENATLDEDSSPGDLRFIVSDLIQSGKAEGSKKLADSVHEKILTQLREVGHPMADLGIHKGPFYVLVGAHMPCVLIEMGYIDNAKDGSLLADAEYRKQVARGIASGIEDFLKKETTSE
ncbi:MAG: hypothetical protein GYA55_08890 [SAR324 cluster bacterium]|uniref:MurNAc-LAA domain-containing protein n=1 Tax=SAR324 cluster bacterium TaxID=2024889 RepID=A0A7X9FSU5_9DELT|nr:hypothetical protein [SAR324 cluster bacterium]